MKKENIVRDKSYQFSLRVIQLSRTLIKNEHEYVISKQILKSGTSIGANIEEAIGAQSRRDFKAKLSISYKEARETHYWLRLIRDSKLIKPELANSLIENCDELLKILGSIIKTLKNPHS
ncbi:four helix bundle protein [Fodinibius halophilus]|uniref:Four helix bundle protein n=1 Tax=Fodinibius halophilus TaxID=1736908 RepID=A0A6M1SV95_9BACT|nr:four helix bundle protein [Fodinibius halophilus]NGP87506.1 four helix bundle protein [Fodinibius halophilus]